MARLSDEEIAERLAGLSGWELAGRAIRKSFDRGDFVGSVEFVRALVAPAEELNHHPDINISWSQVEVMLTTHSEGGLTENDFVLAAKIDELAG
jgi:4a-hydroxytetrahydrobiopterin dehydratase